MRVLIWVNWSFNASQTPALMHMAMSTSWSAFCARSANCTVTAVARMWASLQAIAVREVTNGSLRLIGVGRGRDLRAGLVREGVEFSRRCESMVRPLVQVVLW